MKKLLFVLVVSLCVTAPQARGAEPHFTSHVLVRAFQFLTGTGVEQDYDRAMELFAKAADQGSAEAEKNIGLMYLRGMGVVQDFPEAARWLRRAAEHGDTEAQVVYADLCAQGMEGFEGKIHAYAWYKVVASRADRRAETFAHWVAGSLSPDQQAQAEAVAHRLLTVY